jgi:two-component system response regulator CssR
MSYKINLVEDEKNLNKLLYSYLCREGWEVEYFFNGQAAKDAILKNSDLWILDIMLPDIDGFQLIDQIKIQEPEKPVIFISARDSNLDRIIGLEKGSDDYLAKPFDPQELILRVKNILKRVYKKKDENRLITDNYFFDLKRRKVFDFDEKEIEITVKEFDLLTFLYKHKKQAISREQILNNIWNNVHLGTERVVDDLIYRIRRKMSGIKLETIYGYGYRLIEL